MASRRLGELGFFEREGVVEPIGEGGDVGRLDRGAAPDAQAGRRVAVGADVVALTQWLDHAFALEKSKLAKAA